MSKSHNFFRGILFAASTLLVCRPGLAQEPATVPDADGVNLVAEVRIIKLSVTLDKDGKQQCETLDRLLRATNVRDVEVQCPSRTDRQHAVSTIKLNQSAVDSENLPEYPFTPTNDRQRSVVVVKLGERSAVDFVQAVRGNAASSIVQSPTIAMYSGQSAEISIDNRNVPFVTGVKPIVGDFSFAYQPVISLVPEGLRMKVAACSEAGNVAVEVTLEEWKIKSVEEYKMSGVDGNEITLQVPDVNVDSINATGTVASGDSLLLIPGSSAQPTKPARGVPMTGLKKAFRAEPQEIPTRMAILITMRKTEPVSQPAPPQPESELLSDEQVLSFYLGSGR